MFGNKKEKLARKLHEKSVKIMQKKLDMTQRLYQKLIDNKDLMDQANDEKEMQKLERDYNSNLRKLKIDRNKLISFIMSCSEDYTIENENGDLVTKELLLKEDIPALIKLSQSVLDDLKTLEV